VSTGSLPIVYSPLTLDFSAVENSLSFTWRKMFELMQRFSYFPVLCVLCSLHEIQTILMASVNAVAVEENEFYKSL
jgi:hypothetical protein